MKTILHIGETFLGFTAALYCFHRGGEAMDGLVILYGLTRELCAYIIALF